MSAIKIALVQEKAVPNDKNKNLNLMIKYIQKASDAKADIVLFPEMWSNGYAPLSVRLLTTLLILILKKNAKNGLKMLLKLKAIM